MWDLPTSFVRNWLLALVVMPALPFALDSSIAWGQQEPLHYFQSADLPPGAIGRGQLLRGGPLPGYFQPVEITVPEGSSVSLAVNGGYCEPQVGALRAAMLIGGVYRLRITGIPLQSGAEVYPTIEVISRLHPPPGQETRFPIPIYLTAEELEMAVHGQFVTRVIYLENPNNAFPLSEEPGVQRYQDVRSDEDPLKRADELGRPMAILRMGSRVPTPNDDPVQLGYNYGTPPAQMYEKSRPIPRDAGLEQLPPPAELRKFQQLQYQTNPAKQPTRQQRFPRMPLSGDQPPTAFNSKPLGQR